MGMMLLIYRFIGLNLPGMYVMYSFWIICGKRDIHQSPLARWGERINQGLERLTDS